MTVRRLLPFVTLVAGVVLLASCTPKRVYRDPATSTRPTVADPVVDQPAPRSPVASLQVGLKAATLAREQIGRPYRTGGVRPSKGFDCSGLVQWCYGCVGVELPRVVAHQNRVGHAIGADALRPGDLVFFDTKGRGLSHVGIYIGQGEFVHAPRPGRNVRADLLNDDYWRGVWRGSRRVTDR